MPSAAAIEGPAKTLLTGAAERAGGEGYDVEGLHVVASGR